MTSSLTMRRPTASDTERPGGAGVGAGSGEAIDSLVVMPASLCSGCAARHECDPAQESAGKSSIYLLDIKLCRINIRHEAHGMARPRPPRPGQAPGLAGARPP